MVAEKEGRRGGGEWVKSKKKRGVVEMGERWGKRGPGKGRMEWRRRERKKRGEGRCRGNWKGRKRRGG